MAGEIAGQTLAVAATALLLCSGAVGQRAELSFKLSERTTERLAAEAWEYGKPPGVLDYDPGMGHPFFVFYGISTAPGSQGGFGYFAVNPWTGDVWDLWECRKLSTPALRRTQVELRRRFTRAELDQYPRLAHVKPACIGGR